MHHGVRVAPVGTRCGRDVLRRERSTLNGTWTFRGVMSTLTAAAPSATVTQGGTAPSITPSYADFINGDTVASLTKPTTTPPGRSCPPGASTGAMPRVSRSKVRLPTWTGPRADPLWP
ncbi:MAG: hypothetical protein M0020_00040 [Actinomycetota bacterium]|nr:hypothetical protein [Actinomycetota bacterium]